MSHRRIRAAFVASLLIASFGVSRPASAGKSSDDGLSKEDHKQLALARANGQSSVTLLIAAKPGAAKQVASGLRGLGATVGYRDDALGYLRANVPTGQAEAIASLAGVQAVDVDQVIPLPDPRPQGAQSPVPQTPPSASTPNDNPYMPTGDIGGAQFVAAHPTWDGRGVTVGIVDTGITLDHPSLLTTSTGERKIVDWVTATDEADDNDPTWLDMETQVSGPSFTVDKVSYTAPSAGTFRFAVFNERDSRLGGEVGSDVNRDGNPTGSSGLFAVLWNTTANNVYVDTNQNHSFADELEMTDYKVRYDVNYFGTDNPATAVVERMPFIVQTDGKNKFVNIGIVSAAHGSHVAGIVAGQQLFGGAMSGEAPGAKIVSVRACLFVAGCTAHALIEGMIYAAKQSNVDVINMSIGGLPALNDGNNSRCIVYNRLIKQSNVQMFISAGNDGAGLNTVGDPSVCGKVVGVGAYITAETWASNYGSTGPAAENLHPFSSRGPSEAGGFKPTLVAPGAAVSTTPMWQPGGPVAGTYALPPGYSMFNGTSMASPQAAGAAALLVSAAEQTGVQKQPDQLRQALRSSTRQVSGYGAYEQGNGLMNVDAAWAVLATNNVKTADINSSVEVHTPISQFLATPNRGEGIYDREGVVAGSTYNRRYTFTRTSGGGGSTNYRVSWVGDTDVFKSATGLSLGRGSPTPFDVTVHAPAAPGAYSATLNLDDPATAGIDYQTMNTIVVAEQFSAASNYSIVKSGVVKRNQVFHYFVYVPPGTPAFKVDLDDHTAAGTGQVRFLRFHPFGVNLDPNSSLDCYSPPVPGNTCNPLSRSVTQPQAGVWEVTVEARRTSDTDAAPFNLTTSILGASVSPNPDIIPSATIGVPVARSYTATNLLGDFTGRMVGTTLGSARRGVFTIADLEQQQYVTNISKDTTSFRATIGGTSDPAADLDLFVFNCTTGTCVLAGQSADGDSEESVTINNPAAGNWVVLVDGFAVPAGTTTYNYVDVFVNPAFGAISVTDANALRPAGSSWTVPASVTANAAPAAGRVLLGNVQVRTDANVLVGSADVIVQRVTP
jgi:subtilisin family serine protease